MRTPIEGMARSFDRRMALRRRMLDHLNLHPDEAAAPALVDELRDTIAGCLRCDDPDGCDAWMARGHDRMPPCCQAMGAFLRLEAKLSRRM